MLNGTIKILARVKDIKTLVKDPTWQNLRESLIGTWKEKPAANVSKLRKYLGKNPQYEKLRRILNYLTGSAFRSKTVTHPSITKLRKQIKDKLQSLRENKND